MLGVALLGAGAMGLDAQQSTPPQRLDNPRDVLLRLSVRFEEDQVGVGTVRIQGKLEPGVDASGERRIVPDSVLHLLGEGLTPAGSDHEGNLVYESELAIAPDEFRRPLDVEPPVVEGVDPPSESIRWEGLSKRTSSPLVAPSGSPLRIGLDRPDELRPEATRMNWTLRITPRGRRATTAAGDGLPPDALVYPSNIRAPSGRAHRRRPPRRNRGGV